MPRRTASFNQAILDECMKTQRSLLRISRLLLSEMELEAKRLDRIGERFMSNRREAKTAFENFDQKSTQMRGMLSSVLRMMRDLNSHITRNML